MKSCQMLRNVSCTMREASKQLKKVWVEVEDSTTLQIYLTCSLVVAGEGKVLREAKTLFIK